MYGFAALAKLNPDFLSGSVVASYLRRDGPLAVPDAWRALEPMLVLSVLAVFSEANRALVGPDQLYPEARRGSAMAVFALGPSAGILLGFVFGGVIAIPGGSYKEYLMGGILVQSIVSGNPNPGPTTRGDPLSLYRQLPIPESLIY